MLKQMSKNIFKMLTALYCVTMIHQLFQGRACLNTHKNNVGQTLKLQSALVSVNIRSLKSNITLFCLRTMYLCKFGAENPTGSEDRAQKRLNLLFFFKDDNLKMRQP